MRVQDRVFNQNQRDDFRNEGAFRHRVDDAIQPMDTKNAVIAVLMGLCAGWLASFIVGGSGLFQYAVSGVLGSFVGSYMLDKFKIDIGIRNEIGRDIAIATIGAVLVMVLAHMLV